MAFFDFLNPIRKLFGKSSIPEIKPPELEEFVEDLPVLEEFVEEPLILGDLPAPESFGEFGEFTDVDWPPPKDISEFTGVNGIIVTEHPQGGFDIIANPEEDPVSDSPTVDPILYGKPTAAFSSGTTITLDPSNRIGTDAATGTDDLVTIFIQADQASFSMPNSTTIPTTAIVPYTSSEGSNYIFGTPLEVLTDFNVNTTTFKLQKKIQVDFGLFAGTESAFVDIHTGSDCP